MVVILIVQDFCPAQVPLKWEFEHTSYLDVRHVAKQDISVLGKTRKTETTVRFLFKLRPIKATGATTMVEVTVLACEDTSVTNGSDREENSFKGLVDQKFHFKVDEANREFKLDVPKALVEATFGEEFNIATDDQKDLYTRLADMILRVHLMDALMPLPGKAVSAGDNWRNTAVIKLQPFARATYDRQFVMAGPQVHEGKRVEAINWTSRVELAPLSDEKGLLPLKIKDLKAIGKPTNEGTVLWDGALNRPARIDSLQVYEVELTMEKEGKPLTGKAKGSDSFISRFYTKNPDEK